ncbi:MAG: DUF3365 domain-containing protein [Thermonemataceae bacterium]|nr:DUF3365 domain-containing protein [Thermonemataceae bacterium]
MKEKLLPILLSFVIFACQEQKDSNTPKENSETKKDSAKVAHIEPDYMKKGEEITSLVQKNLLKEVSQAIQKNGTEGAVQYCSLNALKIMDSLSKANNCQVRRVSDKYRNEVDKAKDEVEQEVLAAYLAEVKDKKPLQAKIVDKGTEVFYFKPIMLGMETCLKCHGKKEQIEPKTLKVIQQLYPKDLAVNYNLKDFRGMWAVRFTK